MLHTLARSALPARLTGLALALTLLAPLPAAAEAEGPGPLQTVERLDLARYLGTWYEIAKYPNRFQRQCVADTQAEYRAREDGMLDVINRCRQADGAMAEALGRAYPVGAADSPRLKVRFAPVWLAWLPLVWGNYWVIDLDPAYRLVAVSEPRREFLWILSRTPTVDAAAYEALLARLQARGFELSKIERTPQGAAPAPGG